MPIVKTERQAYKAPEPPLDLPIGHHMPDFGVAIFDESRPSGWACLPNGDPFRFRSPADLASNAIWVTSDGDSAFRERWGGEHHLRPADFVSKLNYIAADYGIYLEGQKASFGAYAEKACSTLAPVINSAMLLASQVYKWKTPSAYVKDNIFHKDLRKYLFDLARPQEIPGAMRSALVAAYQPYSFTNGGFIQGGAIVTLRFNRMTHAKRVMDMHFPEPVWIYGSTEVSSGFQMSLDEALNEERPCLLNVTVDFNHKDSSVAQIIAFGHAARGASGRSLLRTWMTQHELRWMHKYANVQIVGAVIAQGRQELPEKIQLPKIFYSDPVYDLSMPAGLLAEAHWRSLAESYFKPSVEGKVEVTPWAAWLRSQDRAICFELALSLHEQGFSVISYGNGSAVVSVEPARLPDLLEFSMNNPSVAHPSFEPVFRHYGLV
jgi:hypothetical protein